MAMVEEGLLLREGARITFGFGMAYFGSLLVQMYTKLKLAVRARSEGKPFARYDGSNVEMVVADRCSGNLLEWTPMFLCTFWPALLLSHAARADATNLVRLGWTYVAFRAVYPLIAGHGGIGRSGARPLVLLATVPAYLCLAYFSYVTVRLGFLAH